MYYINAILAGTIMLLSLAAYFYVAGKTGKKHSFWVLFFLAWLPLWTTHLLVLGGVSTNEGYMWLLRIVGYLLMIISLIRLIMEQAQAK